MKRCFSFSTIATSFQELAHIFLTICIQVKETLVMENK